MVKTYFGGLAAFRKYLKPSVMAEPKPDFFGCCCGGVCLHNYFSGVCVGIRVFVSAVGMRCLLVVVDFTSGNAVALGVS